ncbi:MAG: helix-turn-helix domain-containing protein [Bacteroidetes bacterium]|nr:MAG: helix-turn-helix domain-containing protein [Bacteroidota bacterium]
MNSSLGSSIQSIRKHRALSQSQLAEKSGLTLRTIQRIEADETTPRGDSLLRIATALEVSIQELTDSQLEENPGLNASIVWSSLSFIAFPFLGFLIPLIIWLPKRGRYKAVDKTAKTVLNFQATWMLLLILTPIVAGVYLAGVMEDMTTTTNGHNEVSPSKVAGAIKNVALPLLLLSLTNIIATVWNGMRAMKGKQAIYPPAIPFIRK